MGIVISNAYLACFGAGTLIGATSAYFICRVRRKDDALPEEKFEVRMLCFTGMYCLFEKHILYRSFQIQKMNTG